MVSLAAIALLLEESLEGTAAGAAAASLAAAGASLLAAVESRRSACNRAAAMAMASLSLSFTEQIDGRPLAKSVVPAAMEALVIGVRDGLPACAMCCWSCSGVAQPSETAERELRVGGRVDLVEGRGPLGAVEPH